MDVYSNNIKLNIDDEEVWVNLKWYRGAARYNNGCTRYGKKYHLRLIIGRAKALSAKSDEKPDNSFDRIKMFLF